MTRQIRAVLVCDGCGTHEDVTDWPQIGADCCDDCAYDQINNHQCRVCGEFDINTGILVQRDGENMCPGCIEDLDEEGAR